VLTSDIPGFWGRVMCIDVGMKSLALAAAAGTRWLQRGNGNRFVSQHTTLLGHGMQLGKCHSSQAAVRAEEGRG
jgi:hypothetical protein